MPQPKRYASHAQRQAAYHRRREETRCRQLMERGLMPLPAIATMPGRARWRQAMPHALHLLITVSTEMEAYSNDRSEDWQDGEKGANFREQLDPVTEIHEALDEVLVDYE